MQDLLQVSHSCSAIVLVKSAYKHPHRKEETYQNNKNHMCDYSTIECIHILFCLFTSWMTNWEQYRPAIMTSEHERETWHHGIMTCQSLSWISWGTVQPQFSLYSPLAEHAFACKPITLMYSTWNPSWHFLHFISLNVVETFSHNWLC